MQTLINIMIVINIILLIVYVIYHLLRGTISIIETTKFNKKSDKEMLKHYLELNDTIDAEEKKLIEKTIVTLEKK